MVGETGPAGGGRAASSSSPEAKHFKWDGRSFNRLITWELKQRTLSVGPQLERTRTRRPRTTSEKRPHSLCPQVGTGERELSPACFQKEGTVNTKPTKCYRSPHWWTGLTACSHPQPSQSVVAPLAAGKGASVLDGSNRQDVFLCRRRVGGRGFCA